VSSMPAFTCTVDNVSPTGCAKCLDNECIRCNGASILTNGACEVSSFTCMVGVLPTDCATCVSPLTKDNECATCNPSGMLIKGVCMPTSQSGVAAFMMTQDGQISRNTMLLGSLLFLFGSFGIYRVYSAKQATALKNQYEN